MVRTYKQYMFIYECLLEEFHAGDTMTDATSIKAKYHEWTNKNTKTGQTYSSACLTYKHKLIAVVWLSVAQLVT